MAELIGTGENSRGVVGISQTQAGVEGNSTSGAGVIGVSESNKGVYGASQAAAGVEGNSTSGAGVIGVSESNKGVYGESKTHHGVMGRTHGDPAGLIAGVFGEHLGGGLAGLFDGKVGVTRDLNVNGNVNVIGDVQLVGADVAEDFSVVDHDDVEPGCVVVLAGQDFVRLSREPYDRRVAGVVSGAGGHRPGLVLDRHTIGNRRPLALTGKAWCKVDAGYGPIGLGDLLTTSLTPGHAMHAADSHRAFGAVIGKALGSIKTGRGLIPVLVALQ